MFIIRSARLFPCLILCLWGFLDLLAQPSVEPDTTALFRQLDRTTASSIAGLAPNSPEEIAQIYTERGEDLKDAIRDGDYLFDPQVLGFVRQIFAELIAANALDLNPTVFVSRSPAVNAASLGDGLFVINIGLLYRMTSRDELASVFAHELAHDRLLHLSDKLDYLAEMRARQPGSRKEYRRLRRRLRKEGRESIMSEMRDLVYEQSRHSRSNELAADSLGGHYLHAAGFRARAAASSLAKLRDYDPFVLSDTILRTVTWLSSWTLTVKEK